MSRARVWGRVRILVKTLMAKGELLISLSMARMARDREEFRRHAQPRQFAKVLTILDIIITQLFMIASIIMLSLGNNENPLMPLRMWIVVYMLYCFFHLKFSIAEFQGGQQWRQLSSFVNLKMVEYGKDGFYLVWWGLGMFFILKGSDSLFNSAPLLTGTVMFFAAFDIILFMCVLSLVTGLALLLFFSTPFLCAMFYYMGDPQELPPCPWC